MSYLSADTLIGHASIRNFLERSMTKNRHHAYLFTGPAHLGKETVGKAFIGTLLERPVEEWETLNAHPDVAILTREEEKKNIGVAEMRVFLRHFTSSSFWGGLKVGIIPNAEDLSIEASNALLKTLEEPPSSAVLLLMTTDMTRLPATVVSRCQTFRFLPVPTTEVRAGLIRRGISAPDAERLAHLASGRPGIAVAFAADTHALTAHEERVSSFLALADSSVSERLSSVVTLTRDATAPALSKLLEVWSLTLRDIVCVKTGNETHATNVSSLTHLRAAAARYSTSALLTALAAVAGGKRLLSENVTPRLIFEHIALSL